MRRVVALLSMCALSAGCSKGRGQLHRGPPPMVPVVAPDPHTPEARARRLVEQLRDRKFAAVREAFDPTMTATITEAALGATWDGIVNRAGRIERIESVVVDAEKDGFRVARVKNEHSLHGLEVRVVFDRASRVSGLWFEPRPPPWAPPAYVSPTAITDRPVDVAGLPGTLTLPKSRAGKARAVLLVHGSGPNDRDETLGGRKPFRDLAEGLATKGLLVLRWDKRSKAAPETLKGAFDQDAEVTADARAAVDLLSRTPEVDPKQIYLVGHSQGARMAPRIASKEPRIAGLVLLAGDTRPFEELLVDQHRYLLGLGGLVGAPLEERLAGIRKECAIARDKKGDPAELVTIAGSKAPRQYWQDLLSYDPTVPAKALALPMLVMQGGRDYQVTKVDFDGWTKALTRPGVVFRFHPPLDHHFVIGESPSTPDDYKWSGHVAGEVVADIAAFVLGTLAS
ncbi:MAG: alpha/beta fold hydrolase [Myxococcales bacterium]|nr:alpha/beta fold hydrolase [Myxococcales bacterium]